MGRPEEKVVTEVEETEVPHVTHNDYKEITLRAILLSALLAVVLGAANVYLGLLVGLTVSASIPASVISMACLRLFKDSNILENNIVQTAASAGEALAAGVIFTLPGLVIMNNERDNGNPVFEGVEGWDSFMGSNYFYSTFLAMFGGLLGIAWSVPLRRALIVDLRPRLKFPEGVATAQVLKSGEQGGNSVKAVIAGGGLGAGISLLESMGLWYSTLDFGWFYENAYPSYFSFEVKPALLGVGYIVGPKIAGVLMLGSIINYWVIIPVSAAINGRWNEEDWDVDTMGEFNVANVAGAEFAETRYIGVGMMLIGGVWSLISIRKALVTGISAGVKQFKSAFSKKSRTPEFTERDEDILVRRYERDVPFWLVGATIVATIIPLYVMFSIFSDEWGYCIVMAIFVAVVSFLFSAVAAYMAGLVGSSNNPVSGVTICSSLILSGLILGMFGSDNPLGPPTAVMMCCAVACACAISGDNMQDLKCGHLLGATPWKQEIIMAVGVVSTSFVIAPILELLDEAYTLGEGLAAPQATVIATIPSGIISGTLPWTYIGLGIGMGALIIMLDKYLEYKQASFRLPVLAFAISTYLPMGYLSPIFLGSCVHYLAGTDPENQAAEGVLYSAGLVAGDSIFGILLAIPVIVTSDADVLEVVSDPVNWFWILPLAALMGSMYHFAKNEPFTSQDRLSTAESETTLMTDEKKGRSFAREEIEGSLVDVKDKELGYFPN
eukprot:Clim_evm2s253 gene=Clim_evmTU2s253